MLKNFSLFLDKESICRRFTTNYHNDKNKLSLNFVKLIKTGKIK